MSYPIIKRFIDFLIAMLLLCLLFPVILVTAFFVAILLGRPVLFKQVRPGLHDVPFTLRKFRTMSDSKDADGRLLSDEQRLNKFGRFLRQTSLDELPQLFNVLVGEMSFVGPRPLLIEYLPLYSEEQRRRHNVRPGITGWAQVNGRNQLSWVDRFRYDVFYVDNLSISLDMKILFLTILKVLKREGVSASGHATMPKFDGSKNESQ